MNVIEDEIQKKGKTAPHVTPFDVEANIVSEHYFTADNGVRDATLQGLCDSDAGKLPRSLGLLTFCVLVLKNGFTVTGESACVSPENFDAEIGQNIARKKAIDKVYEVMGYALREKLHQDQSFEKMDRIARICHEVNRAYCQSIGDYSQKPWEEAPEWQRESSRMGVDLHMMGVFGPEASHISWMSNKVSDGWKYGPVKNEETKEHPCMVPFSELPREQQAKDFIFRAVVHAMKHI